MGSIGVSTGRVTSSQTTSIEENRAGLRYTDANTIAVFPNAGETKWASRTRGFAIAMSGATAAEKKSFVRALRGALNTDNAERSAQRAYRDAVARGATAGQARRAAEEARTAVHRRTVQRVIEKGKWQKIRTRNLNKRDYDKIKVAR